MKFSIALFATALIAGVTADYASVKVDVKNIQVDVATLHQALKAFDGVSSKAAIAIDNAAKALNADLQTANKDAKALSSLSTAQAQSLLTILNSTYANVSLTSKQLIALEPKFKAAGVSAAAKVDIGTIANSTKAFGATLVSKVPAASKAAASSLAAKFNKAFSAAVVVYV
ncbi:unnamed protein product [Tilletia controversa]|uniref:Uncharacterized protein n=3 Tax=Tilletia TaxID=13289 RepID=A0A8X7MPK2_9BASI|nr:hypothetical protein CF336_g5700 [Tilletia laevis]KAE8192712.1 hypothetical protein CF328_g5275 [Tilletia controversa]KAE8240777.1 hypothetical protein A4X03_0g8370 [Tilletia caries]KAE8196294.1 hypothetical protein CF335_g4893 [Tilletia laevis]KAE8243729.1 hypothetical protein A4X06_0g6128 [Tilletia controversa]